jgi:hypothetical protein
MLLEKQEWGRRLYAAMLSCHEGASTIAEVYEFETPHQVDPFWTKMAEALAYLLGRQIAAAQRRKKAVPTRGQKGLFLVPSQAAENNGPEF